uniref:Alpha-endosulfine n=1 Tax=Glossina morsitans morsitans TaxID=37546 RepID=A0A1B0FMW9_GLOMM
MNCSGASGNQPLLVQEEDGDQRKMAKTAELEEEKLKPKYPIHLESSSGHTAFLQKRFQKGQKFFDSGDYQMAKQKCDDMDQIFVNGLTTGELIPTPETVPARKTSNIQFCNKFQTPN